jgi:carbon-monoxide dehydrogenase large subunit
VTAEQAQPGSPPATVPGAGAVPRTEDARLLTGRARYIANLPPQDALVAVFVRSPLAHARITAIDTTEAAASRDVVAVLTAADLDLPALPAGRAPEETARPILARDTVRFAGEAVALVVARTHAAALDAADAVVVDYDPLEPVTDAEAALSADGGAAPVLFPELGTNLVGSHDQSSAAVVESGEPASDDAAAAVGPAEVGDVLADAEVVVSGRFVNQRVAPVPLEAGAVLALPDEPERGALTVYTSTQTPFRLRSVLGRVLGLDKAAVRVTAPDMGGAFGAKIPPYPEQVAVPAVARRLGSPVRWVETRSESFQSLCHGRAQTQHVEVGATRDGVITGLRARLVADVGAYPTGPGVGMPSNTLHMIPGCYRIPAVDLRADCAVTTTTPITAYRGAGRPEATALIERAADLLAAELGFDPVTVRRRNFVGADDFPYTTATGETYDTGDYHHALGLALEAGGYDGLRGEQAARRERGERRLLGVGLSTYVEVTAGGMTDEFGAVTVGADGVITARTGIGPHGQGHETSLAQIVAGVLAVPIEQVGVVHSDTAAVPRGSGTMGSRSLQIGGSAVRAAAHTVRDKARRLAAALLEADEGDVELVEGGLAVAGAPSLALSWAELAAAADDAGRRPDDMEPGLSCEEVFEQDDATYPFGAHVSVVEVDVDTGVVTPVRHVAVDDCGVVLNPTLVDGQVHGGLAQGIAQALWEEMVYDELGNPLTSTLATYAVPMATEMPEMVLRRPQTPTPLNPLGAKGVGEASTIGSTPAVQNAVVDALSHLGVRHVDLPCTPERVWRALRDAGASG